MLTISSLFLFASTAACFSMPPLKGPYDVGTISFEITDTSRQDPLAPDVRTRKLPVSIWYPTDDTTGLTLAPQFTTAFTEYLDPVYLVPDGTSAQIISPSYSGALFSEEKSNGRVLFFSPGYSLHQSEFGVTLANLASNGYIVVGLAHPFDANFIAYEDGTAVTNQGENATPDDWTDSDYVALRAADVSFLAEQLTTNAAIAEQIPGFTGPLPSSHVGVFGHSYGGATAAVNVVDEPELFKCGVNMDGGIYHPANVTGADRPWLNMARNVTVDYTWEEFRSHSTAWNKDIGILETEHMAYLDFLYIQQVWHEQGLVNDNYLGWAGTIDGVRMLDILEAYLTDFFEGCFGGYGYGLLEGPSEEFPEVKFDGFVEG